MYNSGHRDRDIYMYNAFFFSYRSLGNARHITRHTFDYGCHLFAYLCDLQSPCCRDLDRPQ